MTTTPTDLPPDPSPPPSAPSSPASAPDASAASASEPSRAEVDEFFRPFVRHSPPWTVYEVIKTALVCILLLPLRLLFFVVAVALVYLLARLSIAGLPRAKGTEFGVLAPWRRALVMCVGALMWAVAVFCFGVFGVTTERRGRRPRHGGAGGAETAYVLVANHLGWLDIVVLLGLYRSSFVAKGSLERGLVGPVARALQCLFVREGQPLTAALVERVVETYRCHRARAGCRGCATCMNRLLIFPEGTTTNGRFMLPFRSGVFNAGLPVQPLCIRFPYAHWNPTWESVRFRHSLFRTMTQVRNRVHLIQLPVYVPSPPELADSALYAANVQAQLAKALDVQVVELNRKHKFVYHSYLLGRISGREALEKARVITQEDRLLTRRRKLFADNAV